MKGTRSKLKKERKDRSKLFLSNPVYYGDDHIPTEIELIQYNKDSFQQRKLDTQQKISDVIKKDCVNWIRITGISDVPTISRICKEFGLHGFDIKDLLSATQVTKVMSYDKITFVLMNGFYLKEENRLDDMQIAFILGDGFVISFQETAIPIFGVVGEGIKQNNAQLREKGADYLLYILMSAVITMINSTVERIEDLLEDKIEDLDGQKTNKTIMSYLRFRRLEYTRMKRAILSLREEFPNLLHNMNNLIAKECIVYFNNYDDKLRTTLSNLDGYFEALKSLQEIYYNNSNQQMNAIMSRLTLVSTVFIPLTFLVGVWGMNFDNMPELKWHYGYLFAWFIFVVVIVFTLYLFKKNKWF